SGRSRSSSSRIAAYAALSTWVSPSIWPKKRGVARHRPAARALGVVGMAPRDEDLQLRAGARARRT
ncbi:MAG TPA: hypothetical protein VHM30_11305, partial [Gemmatimonadaceae bacterium]|nr:hypothetical protein [Gemmatimonadaceae bacterium]